MLIRLCSVGWVIGRSVGQSFLGGIPGVCAHLRGGLLRGEARATLKGGLPSQLFLKTYDEGGSESRLIIIISIHSHWSAGTRPAFSPKGDMEDRAWTDHMVASAVEQAP